MSPNQPPSTHNLSLLHGENITTSRNYLIGLISQAKLNHQEILKIHGKKTNPFEIHQAIDSPSLFGNPRLVIIEELFSRPKSQEQAQIIQLLTRNPLPSQVILWESKQLTPAQLRHFPAAKVKLFKLEIFVWKFLDNLTPGQPNASLQLFQKSLSTHPPELLLALTIKRFRLLLAARDGGPNGLKKLTRLQPWQSKILLRQAQKFSLPQLTTAYQKLLQIDFQAKTGTSPLTLQQQLEKLLMAL